MILSNDAYWKIATADRVAYLIDGAAYFRAFREAAREARHSILLMGWDFHSQTPLLGDEASPDGYPTRLVPFLDALVRSRRELQVHLLNWDFSVVYAGERESLPVLRLNWQTDRRFHYAMDSELPFGASHHQKVVVIDDSVAFLGGLDLTGYRWDTPEHAPYNPQRHTAAGKPYGPFHDIQLAVAGRPALALGDLCRARWARATGEKLSPPRARHPVWPASAPVHFSNVEIALSRTFSAYKGWPAVGEVRKLHEQVFREAQRFILVENEYLTSHQVAQILAERLSEPEGPEVILIVPQEQSGWLEQSTMGVLRARVLRRLRTADRFGRLRVWAPVHGSTVINLHSKVFVIDDEIMKVGSSNLSNRSMGFDSELDAVLYADGDGGICRGIARFRETLLGEHLGIAPERVRAAIEAHGGALIAGIESLLGQERTLVKLVDYPPPLLENLLPEGSELVDPERPMRYGAFVLSIASETRLPSEKITLRRSAKLALLVAVLLAAAFALDREPISLPAVRGWFTASIPAAPWLLLGFGLIGALLFFPILPLLALIAVLVEPWQALGIGFAVAITGAVSGYATGRNVRRERVRRLSGHWAERVFPWLGGGRFSDFVLFRLFSGVPYGLANLLSGAARVPMIRYIAASAVALALTSFTVVAFTQVIGFALGSPEPWRFAVVGCMIWLYDLVLRSVEQGASIGETKSPPPS